MKDPGARSLQLRFSAASSTYDDHAHVQVAAARSILEVLSPVPEPDRILEIGCGTGQLTRLLLDHFPRAAIDAVDISPGMIRVAKERTEESPRLRWIVDDARSLAPGVVYPLVVANCSLHWLHPIRDGFVRLAGLLAAGGHLAATVMLDGTLLELHAARRLAAPEKVPPGRLPTAETVRAGLAEARLELAGTFQDEVVQATSPSVEHLLHQLRRQGLTGGAVSRAAVPLHRGEIRRLIDHYVAAHHEPGGVRVTYRVGRFVAKKTG